MVSFICPWSVWFNCTGLPFAGGCSLYEEKTSWPLSIAICTIFVPSSPLPPVTSILVGYQCSFQGVGERTLRVAKGFHQAGLARYHLAVSARASSNSYF